MSTSSTNQAPTEDAYLMDDDKPESKISLKSLFYWNLAMAIFHGVQAVVLFVLSGVNEQFRDFKLPIRRTELVLIPINGTGADANVTTEFISSQLTLIGNLRVGPLTGIFSLLSAIFHILVILPYFSTLYNNGIKKGYNYFRWIEYSLSSTIMIFLIALFFGLYDISTLLLIMAANATCMLCGLLMEELNQYTTKVIWTPYIVGCFIEVFPFIAIFITFFSTGGRQAPGFVVAILFVEIAFFSLFAVNMVLQYAKVWKWRDYRFGELVYQILSLVAKTLLAWIVFGGLAQPNAFTT